MRELSSDENSLQVFRSKLLIVCFSINNKWVIRSWSHGICARKIKLIVMSGCEAILDAQEVGYQNYEDRGKMQQERGGTSWVNFINTSASR
jgi:peroxiredoxin